MPRPVNGAKQGDVSMSLIFTCGATAIRQRGVDGPVRTTCSRSRACLGLRLDRELAPALGISLRQIAEQLLLLRCARRPSPNVNKRACPPFAPWYRGTFRLDWR